MTKSTPFWISSIIIVFLCLCTAPAARAGTQEEDRQTAQRFVELFFGEKLVELQPLLDTNLKAALEPVQARQILTQLTAQFGKFEGVGEARFETEIQGQRAFIVPVTLERSELALRVPVNGEGNVTGMRVVEQTPRSSPSQPVAKPPQGVREVELAVGEMSPRLPGLLAFPAGPGPFPAVVLVHGSGPNDRDETIGPNKPLRDLAWGLATRGIATWRYDKRSMVDPQGLAALGEKFTVEQEVVADARAAIALLRARPEIDPERVFVAGHSLGGNLAPRIAEGTRAAGVIMLAGNVRPFHEMLLEQIPYLLAQRENPTPQEREQTAKLLGELEHLGAALRGEVEPPPPTAPIMGMSFAYLKDHYAYDPVATARKLGVPILVVQAGRDYQVPMKDFELWQQGLGGKEGYCGVVYPDLNHLFQPGSGRSKPEEYFQAVPVADKLIDGVAGWVLRGACPQAR